MSETKSYKLPGIDSLRLLAALFIIPPHIEFLKLIYAGGSPGHFYMGAPYTLLGEWSVTFIFLLSGFLITYLLLLEKEQYQRISLSHFFTRRALRLLPLYWFLVLLTLVVFPHIDFFRLEPWSSKAFANQKEQLVLYLLGLANIAPLLYSYVPFLVHSWSIGSEEQFYMLWAPLVKYSNSLVRIAFGVIVVYMLLHIGAHLMVRNYGGGWNNVEHFLQWLRISSMGIGALFAWLHLKDHKWLDYFYHRGLQLVVAVLSIGLIAGAVNFGMLHTEIYSVLFGIIILNAATNPQALLKFNNRVTEYFGKVAYGVYMYHFVAIHISYKITTALINYESRSEEHTSE